MSKAVRRLKSPYCFSLPHLAIMENQELIPHLFRTEFSRITAVLSRHFGLEHLEVAEDLAAETFLAALEAWPYKGVPANPSAWLYAVAKNKAKNYLTRQHLFAEKVVPAFSDTAETLEYEIDLSETNISDSLLQMLFAVCNPVIPWEGQVALSLRFLCGFGIEEIANAFLSNKETINKRLLRAKEKLRQEEIKIELPPANEIGKRIDTVLTTLYLLFNEGYYSESNDRVLREELCAEAMRLVLQLIESPLTNRPPVNALFALMCFQSSRFKARKGNEGEMILYDEQDHNLWDQALISRGAKHLHVASQGNELTQYHLEASMAYWYTVKDDTPEKWENILQLFDHLLKMQYSPVAALNRAFALAKTKGKQAAIAEAEKLQMFQNRFYYALLGDLYVDIDNQLALSNLKKAYNMAGGEAEKCVIKKKIINLNKKLKKE